MLRKKTNLHVFFSILVFGACVSCVKEEPSLIEKTPFFDIQFLFHKPSTIEDLEILAVQKDLLIKREKWASLRPMSNQGQEGYLYFWSFNQETLVPDVFIRPHSEITTEGGAVSFSAGFSFSPYPPGKALSVRGLQEITIHFPLENVISLQEIGFDISSSNTGPKEFHLLYSNDNGVSYDTLSSHNHFMDLGSQKLNRYSFLLDTLIWDFEQSLQVKIKAIGGEATGVTRLDNLYLEGTGIFPKVEKDYTLYYWFFDYLSGALVEEGSASHEEISTLQLQLKQGQYIAHFVYNSSAVPLLTSHEIQHKNEHYISRNFADNYTEIFGSLDTLFIEKDGSIPIRMKRYYSEVRFELTDAVSLEEVESIRIAPLHDPYFYAPFDIKMLNPIQDQSELSIHPDFMGNGYVFSFQQFIGNVSQGQNLRYQIEVFSNEGQLLNAFEVKGNSRNNAKLIFRGKLLDYMEGSFPFVLEEEWDEEDEVLF